MTRLLALAAALLFSASARAAPPVTGFWLTQDHQAVVAIASCGNLMCGRLAGLFLDRASDPMPVDHRGVSQCNLLLITDAQQIRAGLWKGHLTDPRNGHIWGVEFHVDPHGNLALRGFLGVPLLGQTQTWTRYPDPPPADCRIGPRAAGTLPNASGRAQ